MHHLTEEMFKTDTFGSWGLGSIKVSRIVPFEKVKQYAKEINACLLVVPSRGKFYYLKGFNGKKTYYQIKTHLIENQNNGYKINTRTYLFSW